MPNLLFIDTIHTMEFDISRRRSPVDNLHPPPPNQDQSCSPNKSVLRTYIATFLIFREINLKLCKQTIYEMSEWWLLITRCDVLYGYAQQGYTNMQMACQLIRNCITDSLFFFIFIMLFVAWKGELCIHIYVLFIYLKLYIHNYRLHEGSSCTKGLIFIKRK